VLLSKNDCVVKHKGSTVLVVQKQEKLYMTKIPFVRSQGWGVRGYFHDAVAQKNGALGL
jgi:hypothetical protein